MVEMIGGDLIDQMNGLGNEEPEALANISAPLQDVANSCPNRRRFRYAGPGKHAVHSFPVSRKAQRQLAEPVIGPRPDELVVALETGFQKSLQAGTLVLGNLQVGKALEHMQFAFPVLLNRQ